MLTFKQAAEEMSSPKKWGRPKREEVNSSPSCYRELFYFLSPLLSRLSEVGNPCHEYGGGTIKPIVYDHFFYLFISAETSS